jgi:hypothetical protein
MEGQRDTGRSGAAAVASNWTRTGQLLAVHIAGNGAGAETAASARTAVGEEALAGIIQVPECVS